MAQCASAKAHVYKERDALLSDNFVIREISDWAGYLAAGDNGGRSLLSQR